MWRSMIKSNSGMAARSYVLHMQRFGIWYRLIGVLGIALGFGMGFYLLSLVQGQIEHVIYMGTDPLKLVLKNSATLFIAWMPLYLMPSLAMIIGGVSF